MRKFDRASLAVFAVFFGCCLAIIGGCNPFGVEPEFSRHRTRSVDDSIIVLSASIPAPVAPVVVEPPAVQEPVVPIPAEPAFTVIRVRVTAYCPCAKCCGRMTGLTSTQSTAWVPGVAADPHWLPYGTIVSVPGYLPLQKIDDTGGAMKKRHWTRGIPRLDIRFTYHWQAREWGVRYVNVKVYK